MDGTDHIFALWLRNKTVLSCSELGRDSIAKRGEQIVKSSSKGLLLPSASFRAKVKLGERLYSLAQGASARFHGNHTVRVVRAEVMHSRESLYVHLSACRSSEAFAQGL